jgi:hypothetical protein
MALVQVQIDKCVKKGHSFGYVDYVPDFDHKCFRLQFQCENCGAEVFDKVNEKRTENNNIEISETQSRYLRTSGGK